MKPDFAAKKDVLDRNSLSAEEYTVGAIELSDEDLAEVVGGWGGDNNDHHDDHHNDHHDDHHNDHHDDHHGRD